MKIRQSRTIFRINYQRVINNIKTENYSITSLINWRDTESRK